MHLRWREVRPVGVGLVNLGNTCFMNAILQAIGYTPALSQFFSERFSAPNTSLNAPFDFAYALGETIQKMTRSTGFHSGHSPISLKGGSGKSAYRPGVIASRLPSLSKRFSIGTQSDASEFIIQLFSACEKAILFRLVGSRKVEPRVAFTAALFRICGGYLRSQVAWSAQDEFQQLQREGKHQEATDLKLSLQQKRSSERSGIGGHNTHGPSRTEQLVSNTYDPMTVLHIELVGQTLEHSLAAFCEPEKLYGRCYSTPREVNVNATKQMTIHIPPNVLMIHLKRFQNTDRKVCRHLHYPLELDLSPFITESVERRQNASAHINKKEENSARAKSRYELNAICIHEGGSINHGHYYSVVRAPNGMWYICDDSRVYPVSVEKALNQQAYMLFYSRIPHEKENTTKRLENDEKQTSETLSLGSGLEMHHLNVIKSESFGEELSEGEAIARLRERRQKEACAAIENNQTNKDHAKISKVSLPHPSFSSDEKTNRHKTNEKPYTWTTASAMREPSDDSDNDESNEVNYNLMHKHISNKGEKDPLLTLSHFQNNNSLWKEDHTEMGKIPHQPLPLSLSNALRPPPSLSNASSLSTTTTINTKNTNKKIHPNDPIRSRKVHSSLTDSDKKSTNIYNGNTTSIVNTNLKQPSSAIAHTGIHAVAKLHDYIAQTTPSTIQRSADAPKFQQRVRDPMWEMEMDRGRVKKVRSKNSGNEFSQVNPDNIKKTNPFQDVASSRLGRQGNKLP
ncbi:unnamed protein product [Phytomonas sp. Hart1]|nr:unnamed protein product [Phytomonas sp. Hart1]|eukprot:CCW66070.1 unnamed protein product [Phytomonas sp. isolate Hart1]